ncbi:MAG: hypothetical protein SCL54_04785 [Bacillota bacterium]|nr:hypothetical protein [Bacillota bacterium]
MVSLRERMKSVLIIGLFLTALLLMQWVMYDDLFASDIDSSDIEINSTKLSAYINPQSYFVSFGGISYTRVYDVMLQERIWSEIRPVVLNSFKKYDSMEIITRESYIEAFSNESMLLRMPMELTVAEFYSLFSSDVVDASISKITPYEYLLNGNDSSKIYVYDRKADQYYMMSSDVQIHDIGALVKIVKQSPYIEYRKISTRFSLESTVDEKYDRLNYELIPFQYSYVVPKVRFSNEIEFLDGEMIGDIQRISGSVFGNRMDFVKRLKDANGSTILMYGYGDKVLTLSPNGEVLYHKRFDAALSSNLDFKEAFSIAAGKIENFGLYPSGIYLADYDFENGTDTTHVFYFGYRVNNYSLAETTPDSHPIRVEIRGNQVVNVYKDIKQPIELIDVEEMDRLYSIDECISNNFLEVSVYYLQDNNIYDSALDNIEYYFPIRSEITKIDMRYSIEGQSGSALMVPTWQVVISGRTYLFNAYTGTLIKTYR